MGIAQLRMVLLQLLQLVRHLSESFLGLLGLGRCLLQSPVCLVKLALNLQCPGSTGLRMLAHLQGLGLPPLGRGPQRRQGRVRRSKLAAQVISLNADFGQIRPETVSLGDELMDEALGILSAFPFVAPPLGSGYSRRYPHGEHCLLQAARFRVLRVTMGHGRRVPGGAQLVTQPTLHVVHTLSSGVAFLLVPPRRPILLLAINLVGILSPNYEKLFDLLSSLGQ
mmetsp:Transcript_53240/g.116887  ORF Transcript_53240/g.116887 Transcript_53240/m.116887 type:complete len:224 (+) Transcript_53240:1203-1874(+)